MCNERNHRVRSNGGENGKKIMNSSLCTMNDNLLARNVSGSSLEFFFQDHSTPAEITNQLASSSSNFLRKVMRSDDVPSRADELGHERGLLFWKTISISFIDDWHPTPHELLEIPWTHDYIASLVFLLELAGLDLGVPFSEFHSVDPHSLLGVEISRLTGNVDAVIGLGLEYQVIKPYLILRNALSSRLWSPSMVFVVDQARHSEHSPIEEEREIVGPINDHHACWCRFFPSLQSFKEQAPKPRWIHHVSNDGFFLQSFPTDFLMLGYKLNRFLPLMMQNGKARSIGCSLNFDDNVIDELSKYATLTRFLLNEVDPLLLPLLAFAEFLTFRQIFSIFTPVASLETKKFFFPRPVELNVKELIWRDSRYSLLLPRIIQYHERYVELVSLCH